MREWALDASCRGLMPELFFFDHGETKSDSTVRMILKMCRGCDVRSECLEEALSIEGSGESGRHGIWGGLTPTERSQEWRDRVMDATNMCVRGLHVMDEENTGFAVNGSWRFCRACRDRQDRRYPRAS